MDHAWCRGRRVRTPVQGWVCAGLGAAALCASSRAEML